MMIMTLRTKPRFYLTADDVRVLGPAVAALSVREGAPKHRKLNRLGVHDFRCRFGTSSACGLTSCFQPPLTNEQVKPTPQQIRNLELAPKPSQQNCKDCRAGSFARPRHTAEESQHFKTSHSATRRSIFRRSQRLWQIQSPKAACVLCVKRN